MNGEIFEVVTIGGQSYPLPSSHADSVRRRAYFTQKIYEKEVNVLEDVSNPEKKKEAVNDSEKKQSGGGRFFDKEEKLTFSINLTKYTVNLFDLYVDTTIEKYSEKLKSLGTSIESLIQKPLQVQSTQFLKTTDFGRVNEIKINNPTALGDIVRAILTHFLGSKFSVTLNDTKNVYETDGIVISTIYLYSNNLRIKAGVLNKNAIQSYEKMNLVYFPVGEDETTLMKSGELFPLTGTFTISQDDKSIFTKLISSDETKEGDKIEEGQSVEEGKEGEGEGEEEGEEGEEGKKKKVPYLKKEEKEILKALGFDIDLLKQLGAYLPDFFDSLPSCSTDTAMLLKKDCETAYFVLWSVMFAAQNVLNERIKAQPKDTFMPDINAGVTRQATQSLYDIHTTINVSFELELISQLFTLGFGSSEKSIKDFTASEIQELFTIFRKGISEDEAIRRLLTHG